jgi:hypothetical protein
MKRSTASRAFVAIVTASAFLWTLTLSVSPQLHERIHPDANRLDHSCAVTFIASGNYNHSPAAPLLRAPVAAPKFYQIPALNSIWVQPLFLGAHIFAHAPPALI